MHLALIIWISAVVITVTNIVTFRIGRRLGGEYVRGYLDRKETSQLNEAINIIDGVVFPTPDDPSWILGRLCRDENDTGSFGYHIGDLWVIQDKQTKTCGIVVGTQFANSTWTWYSNWCKTLTTPITNYFYAIDKAYIQREAYKAISTVV